MFTRRSDQPRIQVGFLTSLVLIGMAILPHGYAQQGAMPPEESIASLRQRVESGDPGAQTEISYRYYLNSSHHINAGGGRGRRDQEVFHESRTEGRFPLDALGCQCGV